MFPRKLTQTIGALAVAGIVLSGCSTIADPDAVGLYYLQGSSQGNHFGFCIEPGQAGDAEWNNEVIFLPTNLRTWTIDGVATPNGWVAAPGADSGDEIVVSALPEKDQPSGVQVRVATKTNFNLNTYCDKDGGVVRQFWEKIGRRYGANDPQKWKDMLLAELVPTQKAIIKDVVRGYQADVFIANLEGVQGAAQKMISERLAVEFNRVAGGNFFCGPSFDRRKPDCPPLELLIIGVEFADPGIQAARNEKVKAIELAAAKIEEAKGEAAKLVEEARGKKNAAAEMQALYATPAWVQLQLQMMQVDALKACGANPNCHMFVGSPTGASWIFSTK